ncbi:MAG: hypothetical protein Q8N84_03220 [bacterium]|nr:hypothetical protein [bacterium]
MEIYWRSGIKLVPKGLIEVCPSVGGTWAVAKGQKIKVGDLLSRFPKNLDGEGEVRSKYAAAVEDIVENQSLLLQVSYLSFSARLAAKPEVEGELQVLKGVGALTSQDWAGKILLFPGSLSAEVLIKAQALGAVGAVVGSLDWGSFKALSERGFGLLVLEGLGNWTCSGEVWRVLKSVAGFLGIIYGEREELLIPDPHLTKGELPAREEGMVRLQAGQFLRVFKGDFQEERLVWNSELKEKDFVQRGNIILE